MKETVEQRLLKRAIQDAEWQIIVRRKLIKEWRAELVALRDASRDISKD